MQSVPTRYSTVPNEKTPLVRKSGSTHAAELAAAVPALEVKAVDTKLPRNTDDVPERLLYQGKLYLLTDASDSVAMIHDPACTRATRRMGAIVVTFLIELVVAFQISLYTATLSQFPLLMSFLPVISAVSGNVGLQSGSLTARGIEVGTVKTWGPQLWRETTCGIVMAAFSTVIFFVVSGTWADSARFGAVIGFCTFCSTMIAAFFGTLGPLIFKHLGTDPISWAGPLETGIQDVLGNTAFLYIANKMLTSWKYI